MSIPMHRIGPEQLVKYGMPRDLIAASRILNRLSAKGYLPFQEDTGFRKVEKTS